MLRPSLTYILAIKTPDLLNIKATVNQTSSFSDMSEDYQDFPLKNLNLFFSNQYTLKIRLFNDKHQLLHENIYHSNHFGEFSILIPLTHLDVSENIASLQIYEISYYQDLEILLGSYLFHPLESFKKIIITDFDKTLAETCSKNPKAIWGSLTQPVTTFPTINSILTILNRYCLEGHSPFIVSSSPHFYESTIRNWLYQHQIFNANILLKDYRQMLHIRGGHLKIKDVLAHGFYKIDHLFNIIFMTDLPDHIVLLGDNYDADHIIYLTFAHMLKYPKEPWQVWNTIKRNPYFRLSSRQDSIFLEHLYRLGNLLKKYNKEIKIEIYIREIKGKTNWKSLPSFVHPENFDIHYLS